MFHRVSNILKSNSFFLFGARGTGKTTYIKELLKDKKVLTIDLLDVEIEDRYNKNPNLLLEQVNQAVQNGLEWVFIDEIQKIPNLTNLVHKLIESTPIKFALTGSSARKLKRGAANLLAGRAFMNFLYPLTHVELRNAFNLDFVLEFGSLPKIFNLETELEKKEYLRSYALTYFKEEIRQEQVVRKLDPFRNFLEIAAQMNGEIINYSNISKDVGADIKTIQSYYSILEDTLLGFFLEPYHKSIRKRQRHNPKFYFFDTGIKRALGRTLEVKLLPQTYEYGLAFEHFVICEIIRLESYFRKDWKFSYLRTKDNAEIDLIIERPGLPIALLEIKSSNSINNKHVEMLNRFAKDFDNCDVFCFSRDKIEKKIGSTNCLYWEHGIKELGLS